jgi:hypothetical protein
MHYYLAGGFALLVWIAIVLLNERFNLLSCDRFPSDLMKWIAYCWLGLFLVGVALLVTNAALTPATLKQLTDLPFYSLFSMHAILVVFLAGWWLLSGMPEIREFLQIRHERPAEVAAIGVSVGVGGWVITLVMAMIVGLLLQVTDALEQPPEPPAMIGWMANLAIWKKVLIVLSAMTIEDLLPLIPAERIISSVDSAVGARASRTAIPSLIGVTGSRSSSRPFLSYERHSRNLAHGVDAIQLSSSFRSRSR